ncbi:MAG: cysteine desulfurase/selenocysteine lyase [Enterobacterales bacterium]
MLNPKQLHEIRACFPFYNNMASSQHITYLDNAATTQKLSIVIDCLTELWTGGSANVHRSSHSLANRLTERFEQARGSVAHFINASESSEIVWTTGVTEGINLVANSWGEHHIKEGDEILVSAMEHHANMLPWQQLCERKGAKLKVIPLLDSAEIDLDALDKLLNDNVRLVAITHISNVLGSINPLKSIIDKCHQYQSKVLVDGAQAIAHLPVDVQDLNCDFYVFSGHKCFAPEATGVLYGKKKILASMPPWKTGGEMVKTVSYDQVEFQEPPFRFEAGTPNVSGLIALSEALQFLSSQDRESLRQHEEDLTTLLEQQLLSIEGLIIHSKAKQRSSIVAFSVRGCAAMDIAALLDEQNIAVRSGQLCAMPLVNQINPSGLVRVSLAFYNSQDDIMKFVSALKQALELLSE